MKHARFASAALCLVAAASSVACSSSHDDAASQPVSGPAVSVKVLSAQSYWVPRQAVQASGAGQKTLGIGTLFAEGTLAFYLPVKDGDPTPKLDGPDFPDTCTLN